MKKEFLVAVSVLFGMAASLSVSAQEKLSLKPVSYTHLTLPTT